MPVLEGFQSFRIETVDAFAYGLTIKTDTGGNRQGALAATGAPDDLSALHSVGRSGARVSQFLDRCALLSGQVPQADWCHGPPPLSRQQGLPLYPPTCRMHHLESVVPE